VEQNFHFKKSRAKTSTFRKVAQKLPLLGKVEQKNSTFRKVAQKLPLLGKLRKNFHF
jgi:hypothetical protein